MNPLIGRALEQATALQIMPRLLAKTMPIPECGCLVWLGSCGNSGYGKIRLGTTFDYGTHRVAYAAHYGDIPGGLCVLHRCDVRTCVNPAHLFLGTKSENTRDMWSKGRGYSDTRLRTHCPKGHDYSGRNIKGARICMICQHAAGRRYLERKRNG